jgi:cytoskeletal protein CcmA (bactofilin family)
VHAEKVRLDSQARFIGEIHANALSVSEGAIFHGSCSMDIEENEDVQKLRPKDAKGKEIKKSVPEPKVQVVEN